MQPSPPEFKDYFLFTRKERNSVLVILFIGIIIIFSPYFYENYIYESHPLILENNGFSINVSDSSTYDPNLFNKTEIQVKNTDLGLREEKVKDWKLYDIDPIDLNKATSDELQKLNGIGPVLGDRIVKFRSAKGGYSTIEELKRIYGLSPETFEKVQGQLVVTGIPPITQERKYSIDINTENREDFMKLNGIGPVISDILINYRDSKNGFDSIADLKNVYSLSEELFESIQPYLKLSQPIRSIDKPGFKDKPKNLTVPKGSDGVKKMDINKVTDKDLETIHGIGPFYSRNIVELREKLGGYHTIDQLQNVYGMKPEIVELLGDYVSIQSPPSRFDINEIEFRDLLRMGLLKYEEVKYIFQLKNAQNGIMNENQLRKLKGIPPKKMDALIPYILFHEKANN